MLINERRNPNPKLDHVIWLHKRGVFIFKSNAATLEKHWKCRFPGRRKTTPGPEQLQFRCATPPPGPEREDPSACLGVKGLWEQPRHVMNELLFLTLRDSS